MSCKNALLSCASAIALALAMTQTALALPVEEAPSAEAPAAAPAAEQAAAAPAPVQAPAQAPAPAAMAPMPSPMTPPEIPPEVLQRMEQHRKLMAMSPEERWEARRAELNKRWEDLRARAAEAGMSFPEAAPWDREPEWLSYDQMRQQMQEHGVELPEQPAWPDTKGMSGEEMEAQREAMRKQMETQRAARREQMDAQREARREQMDTQREARRKQMDDMRKQYEQMAAMSPEEREAFREKQYQEMRERAAAGGVELPETPPWKRPPAAQPQPTEPPATPAGQDWSQYKETIDAMSPEQREACMAMHRMHKPRRMRRGSGPMAPPRGYGPGYGNGPGPGFGYGPGRGYGPRWGGQPGQPE